MLYVFQRNLHRSRFHTFMPYHVQKGACICPFHPSVLNQRVGSLSQFTIVPCLSVCLVVLPLVWSSNLECLCAIYTLIIYLVLIHVQHYSIRVDMIAYRTIIQVRNLVANSRAKSSTCATRLVVLPDRQALGPLSYRPWPRSLRSRCQLSPPTQALPSVEGCFHQPLAESNHPLRLRE